MAELSAHYRRQVIEHAAAAINDLNTAYGLLMSPSARLDGGGNVHCAATSSHRPDVLLCAERLAAEVRSFLNKMQSAVQR